MAVPKPAIRWVGASANNYTKGRTARIDRITFHHIVGTGASCEATFNNPSRGASATYSVGEDGLIRQHISEKDTPWSDGNWESNQRTISIEHAGGHPNVPYTSAMYKSAGKLHAWIIDRYGMTYFPKHREVSRSPTVCSGGLDRERILADARAIIKANNTVPQPPPPPNTPSTR